MDIAAADLTDVAGARIKRKLMAGGKKETAVIFESMLCAIAVMDIEIDDRDRRQTMNGARMVGRDGHIIEQAKAHGAVIFGVVSGWPDGAKSVGDLAGEHRVDRRAGGAGGAKSGDTTARRHEGVGVEHHLPTGRHRRQNAVDIGAVMGARQLVDGRRRRHSPIQTVERRRGQGVAHGDEARRLLRMSQARIVIDAGWVEKQGGGHRTSLAKRR